MASAKHFIGGGQDLDKEVLNSQIDERTRFEMYYEPFQGAIEANVSSVMCSNKVNGNFTCADDQILNKELK